MLGYGPAGLAQPTASRRSRLPVHDLDLGRIEDTQPVALAVLGLSVPIELDQERLVVAQRLQHGAHLAWAQCKARNAFRERVAPPAFVLVQFPRQPRPRHSRGRIRYVSHRLLLHMPLSAVRALLGTAPPDPVSCRPEPTAPGLIISAASPSAISTHHRSSRGTAERNLTSITQP